MKGDSGEEDGAEALKEGAIQATVKVDVVI